MQAVALGSRELLTARQVQQLLHIDRSTVYRMAGDGRLASIRVGRQLRFPADRLGGLLEPEPAEALDARVAEATIEVMADLLGVTMVVTDMAGRPVTAIANPSPWFASHTDDEDRLRSCLEQWRSLADDPDLAPRFVANPAGFECARAFIRSGSTLVGMVLAGGIAAAADPERADLHQLDGDGRAAVLRALPRIAAALGARIPSPNQEEAP